MASPNQEAEAMLLHCQMPKLPDIRAFAAPVRCTQCGERMVAPLMSEFAPGGEIRHHWVCEACGEVACTVFALGKRPGSPE